MSETLKRIISGIVLAGIVIAALYFSRPLYWIPPVILVLIVSLFGLFEYYRMTDHGVDGRPIVNAGVIFTILLGLSFYARTIGSQSLLTGSELPEYIRWITYPFAAGSDGTLFILFIFILYVLLYQLIFRPIDGNAYSVSVTLTGVLYTGLPVMHTILYFIYDQAAFYLVFVILVTSMTDAGAYFAGKFFGTHNAGLRVSPRKTYEGYVGGFFTAIISATLFITVWNLNGGMAPIGVMEASVTGAFLSIITVIGDLVESALKRDAKTKDSASLIPGHGGMLDLADALFLTIPAGYYILYFKQMAGFSI